MPEARNCEQAKSGDCCYCKNFVVEKIKNLIIKADNKSEELLLGDFKQYFDEEFSPAVWELLGEIK